MDDTALFARLGFVFLLYCIIASGYVTQFFPCQNQRFFENNIVIKHITGYVLIFSLIMLEGGWEFTEYGTVDATDTDWTNANSLHSLVWALIIYLVFLFTSKMDMVYNLTVYALLFTIYVIYSYKEHMKVRDKYKKSTDDILGVIVYSLFVIACIIALIGILLYFLKKHNEYGKKFNLTKFLLGSPTCSKTKMR